VLASLAGSLALHALALAALPVMIRGGEPPSAVTLDVVLVSPEPLALVAPEPSRSPPPEPQRVAAAEPPRAAAGPRSSPVSPREREPVQKAKAKQATPDRAAPTAAEPHSPEAPGSISAPSEPGPGPESAYTAPPPPTPHTQADAGGREASKAKNDPASVPPHVAAIVTPPTFNAAYLSNPPPRYPLIARRNGEEGTVMLKVLVTHDGRPASVSLEATSGSHHLDRAALETVKNWRFAPARQGAQPVKAWVLVPIVFRLEGSS
jgi:periplasmic protein TonB